MVSVGSQWCPLATCTGNVQMSFWSRRKSPGRLFHVTSRAAGDVLLSLFGRVDFAGLSGTPPVVCAEQSAGAQKKPILRTILSSDCLFMRIIRVLGCSSLVLGVLLVKGL